MKKILIILFVLILIAFVALAAVLLTFDVDQYRPMLVKQIEQAIQKPVTLDYLSLTWKNGLALRLEKLAIYPDREVTSAPMLKIGEANAVVNLMPLLTKKVEVSHVFIEEPFVKFVRKQDGTVIVPGLEAAPPAPAPEKGIGPVMPLPPPPTGVVGEAPLVAPETALKTPVLPFQIDILKVRNGKIEFHDETGQMAHDLQIGKIDIDIRDISLTNPMEIEAHAAVFSYDSNVHVTGRFKLPSGSQPAQIKSIRLETDLRQLEMPALVKTFPDLQGVFVPDRQAGELMAELGAINLTPEGFQQLTALVRLQNGRMVLTQVSSAIDAISAELLIESDRLKIRRFAAQFAGGKITAGGEVDHWMDNPQITLDLAAENIELNEIQPKAKSGEPEIFGKLSADFHGVARGRDGIQIMQNMSGQGRVSVLDGRIANLNVLQEVFRNLEIIPGLVDRLHRRLPEHYNSKLEAKDTPFQFLNVPVVASKGVIYINDFFMTSDAFQILGTAWYAHTGQVEGQTILRLDTELSEAFIRSVEELQYLTNPQRQLEIPIRLSGIAPNIRVFPDVQFVASRLAVSKTRDVITDLIRKNIQKEAPVSAPQPAPVSSPSPPQQTTSSGSLFDQLLKTAMDELGTKSKTS